MYICVIGVGYVGLVTGACFAEMGNKVLCIDTDEKKITSLKAGSTHFYEPSLEELIKRNSKGGRLFFRTCYEEIKQADMVFIAVGTPPLSDGSANVSSIISASNMLAKYLRGYTVIVNKSTAPIGTTLQVKKEIFESLKNSSPSLSDTQMPSFDVIACPEFLKEGSAVHDCLKPDRIVVGYDSKKALTKLTELYKPFNINCNRIISMDIPSAELTKYASNAMLASRISFMNEISRICEVVGADINSIRHGMSGDHRIGKDFLYAGLGYGGSCFPKDIKALIASAKKIHIKTPLLSAIEEVNENQKKFFFKKISDYFKKIGGLKSKVIAIWGLSFKPNTDDIREAPALKLIDFLLKNEAFVKIFDPVATTNVTLHYNNNNNIIACSSEYHAADNADGIVLATEWPQFRLVNLKEIHHRMNGNVIFDGRNQYDSKTLCEKGFEYVNVGTKNLI